METCYLHPNQPGTIAKTVPCAPGGKIWLCAECDSDSTSGEKVWAKYKESHAKNIQVFKAPANPRN